MAFKKLKSKINSSNKWTKKEARDGSKAIGKFLLVCLMFPLYAIFGTIINILSLYTNLWDKLVKDMQEEAKKAVENKNKYTVLE